jgi:hypothetical protein
MTRLTILFLMFFSFSALAQETEIDWYILEKGCSVNTIKPGVNDLTFQLASNPNKPLDKTAVDNMLNRVEYSAGNVVLVYKHIGELYLATDMEGRNLVIKGKITKAEHGVECGVGYMKEAINDMGVSIASASYIWIREKQPANNLLVIQCAGNVSLKVDVSKVYDVSQLMLEMAGQSKYKTVK